MTSTQMRQWWDGLDATGQADWLHAYQNGPSRHLVEGLPQPHRPGDADEWISGAQAQWDNSPSTTEWFFTTEFAAFIAERYEESIGGQAIG